MTTYKDILVLVDKVTSPLKKISDSMQKATKDGDKLKDKFEQIRKKMERMKPAMRTMWSGIKKLTSVFVGLVGASGILTAGIVKMTNFADNIDKMSQKIGMSIQDYQKWNYIMSINGGSVDSLKMGFKTLTTQIEGVQKGSKDSIKAFSALGVKVKDNTGKFRKQTDIFYDAVQALQKIENATQRDILANRLFGRSAAELRPLLNMSADSMAELVKNFDEYGMGLSEETIKRATKFKDTWTTFTQFLQANTIKAMGDLYPQLQQLLDSIMRHKEEILKVITLLGKITFEVIKFTAVLMSVIYKLAKATKQIWGIIVNVFTGIKNFIIGVIQSILGFIDKLLEKLGWLAYLIPGLNMIKIGKNIAGAFSGGNSVRQSQVNNTTTNTTTNNFYNGNTNNYNGMFGFSGAIYAN